MMDHQTVQDLFSEYMEGDLSDGEAREVREHLDSCVECREAFERFKDSVDSLRSLSRVSPPQDLEQKIKKRIRARSRGRFFSEASQPHHVLTRVPFEFISLILILIALACFYLMTLVGSMEATRAPDRQEDREEKVEEIEQVP